MDLVSVSNMTLIYSFYLGLFGLILSYKLISKMILKTTKGYK